MVASVGHRGRTVQRFGVGADKSGKIQSIVHENDTNTSFVGDFSEPSGLMTRMLYDTPNLAVVHNVVQLNSTRAESRSKTTTRKAKLMPEFCAARIVRRSKAA